MKLVPPITIDDTNMTTDAVAESYDTWGTDYSLQSMYNAPAGVSIVAVNPLTGEIWVKAGYYVYYKANATSAFVQAFEGYYVSDIDVNPYTGRVYCTKYVASSEYRLYEVDTTTYALTALGSSVTSIGSMKLSIDFYTSNIYMAGYGNDNVYVYTDSTGSVTVHAATGLSTIQDIAIDSDKKDIYVIQYSTEDIYRQVAATGSFNSLITTFGLTGIQVNPLDSSIVVWRIGGTPTVLTAAYDATVLTTVFTAANNMYWMYFDWGSLSYLVAENSIDLKCYTSRLFEKSDYCIYNDRVYLALADTYNDNPSTNDTVWFDYGATNPYRMFDGSIESSTTATEEINITLENDNVTAIAFFGVTAESITVTLTVDTIEVYSETKTLRSTEVADWYEYFFNPINQIKDTVFTGIPAYQSGNFDIVISGASPTDTVEVGLMVAGYSYDVGTTKPDVKPGFVDYSTVTTDDFGRITITERGSAKTLDCSVHVKDRDKVTTVLDLMNRTRGLKCLWIASKDEDSWSLIYGIRKRFDMVARNTNGEYTLQILGVV